MKFKKSDPANNLLKGMETFQMIINNQIEGGVKRVPENVKSMTEKLQDVARKYRMALVEMEDVVLEYNQEWIISEPMVYISRTKDKKTDIEYFTAKTFWPQKGGKKKEIRIYLGKAADYGNDTQSIRAKEQAKVKMSETLRRRKDLGEI